MLMFGLLCALLSNAGRRNRTRTSYFKEMQEPIPSACARVG